MYGGYGKCPVECGSTYGTAPRSSPGHKGKIKTGLLLKINECFELHNDPADGEAAALRLIRQKAVSE